MKKVAARKPLVIWGGVSFVLALGASLALRSYLQHRAYQNEMHKIAVDREKVGIMSQAEHARWHDLNSGVLAGKKLSDEDFDWCLMTVSQPKPHPIANAVKNANIINGVLLKMVQNNDTTPERRERLYKEVAPLLRSKQQLDRLVALNLMRDLKERRAVPDILPMLNDPHPDRRKLVRQALDKMGYHAGGNKTP